MARTARKSQGQDDLDDRELVRRIDAQDMLATIRDLPAQCRLGWAAGKALETPSDYARATAVVVAGVGGSALGGDIVRAVIAPFARVPISIVRDYSLPHFVGPGSLVVCSSYSGGTEETLSAFAQALERKAKLVLMGTGGRLFELGAAFPALRLQTKGMPRSALGESALALLGLFQSLGFIPSFEAQVRGACAGLVRTVSALDIDIPESRNPAKGLARQLHGRIPLVVGIGRLGPLARRWKAQFNENADQWAFFDELPEFSHNAIQGLRLPAAGRRFIHVVFLCPEASEAESVRQAEIAAELLREHRVPTSVLTVQGADSLDHALSAVALGDFVSFYLALLNGVDPTPIASIAKLKQKLAARRDRLP